VLVLALVAASAGTVASSAQAADGMEVGLQDDLAFVTRAYFSIDKAYKLADQLKVSRLRVNVIWANVVKGGRSKKKPKHISYDWSSYDSTVSAARAHGVRVELTLTGTSPAWATGNHKIGNVKPNASLFRDFARHAAIQFKGKADRYSIWNEPNFISWISPQKSAAKIYRSLYLAGYGAIKSVDPSAQVLIGETSPYSIPRRAIAPLKFLKDVAKSGGLKADGYAHHPYDFRHSINYNYPGKDNATLKTLGNLTKVLDSLAASHKLTTPSGKPLDLYLTEWGYMAPGAKYAVKDSTRAKYLTQGFNMAVANPRVKQLLQYLLVQPPKRYRFFDMSLVNRKGKQTGSFKALAKWAAAAAGAGKIAASGPAYHAP
jgi:hypothetical protein